MKVWVTKYWYSQGIYEERVEVKADDDRYVLTQKGGPLDVTRMLRLGREAFHHYSEAVEWARGARKRKIDALNKQIKKLEEIRL